MHFFKTRKYMKNRGFFKAKLISEPNKLLTKLRNYQIKSTPGTESAFSNKQTKLSR